jgi:uncharacterized membrane protein
MSILRKHSAKSHETLALIAGIAAFTTWGLIPVYWKLLKAVSPLEILAHRFVWTSLFLTGLLSWQRRWPEVKAVVSSRRATLYCLAAGVAVAINWFFFIFAVIIGRVIETSLGYFMTPLVNVLFGVACDGRRSLSDVRLRSFSLDLCHALHNVRSLRIAAKEIGHGRNSWIISRNDHARARGAGVFGLAQSERRAPVRSRQLVYGDLVDHHRHCHRRSIVLVWIRRALSAAHHHWLFAIPRADRLILPRRLPLSRTFHARPFHHLRFNLDRARHFHLRSSDALAINSCSHSDGARSMSTGSDPRICRPLMR